jgi:hypothetical protein
VKISDISLSKEDDKLPINVRHALIKPDDLSPLSAYLTLKELFGDPNNDFDDLKSQWAYFLRVPNAYIEIYDWKLESWSISVYEDSNTALANEILGSTPEKNANEDFGEKYQEFLSKVDEAKAEKIGLEFLDLLRKHISKSASKIKKAAAEANQFVIQNPFALYYNSASNLLNKTSSIINDVSDYYRSAFFSLLLHLKVC